MKIFIAGGTSGIGFALAKKYIEKGNNVAVCGRSTAKLNACELPLAKYECDVLDKEKLLNCIQDFKANSDLDVFINCAGSYAEDIVSTISYEEAVEMLQINISGNVNCFEAARIAMKNQKHGHIIAIASVSGILEYENSSLYTKTKRSVIQIGDAYRRALQPFGIAVSIIAPGYVDTQKLRDLNQNDLSKKIYLITENEAADKIIKAIENKKNLYIFPKKMKFLMKSLSILPSSFLNLIMYRKAKWMKKD